MWCIRERAQAVRSAIRDVLNHFKKATQESERYEGPDLSDLGFVETGEEVHV
jgi:hypothetical protein